MDDYFYAWKVLNVHTQFLSKKESWIGLELGPGDGLLSALLAAALGSRGLTLVDTGDFAHRNGMRYQHQINQFLIAFPSAKLSKITSDHGIENMLSLVDGSYKTQGLSSLRILESGSFDLIFSQAVL
jgi:hypothetical protein